MSVALIVNGHIHEPAIEADTPLLWALREHLSLTGTKYGCGIAQTANPVDAVQQPRPELELTGPDRTAARSGLVRQQGFEHIRRRPPKPPGDAPQ